MNIAENVYGKLCLNGCRIPERTINEKQGGFRRVRNSVDKIFPFRIITENCQWKQKKDYAVTLVLDKAYDRNDQTAMCNIYWRCMVWVGGKKLLDVNIYHSYSLCSVYVNKKFI